MIHLDQRDDQVLPAAAPGDEIARALHRIAGALERLVEINGVQGLDQLPAVRPFAAQTVQDGSVCPVHGVPWKTVSAGVSRRTGSAYDAFMACSVSGCSQRPPR